MAKMTSSPIDRALETVAMAIVKKLTNPDDIISVDDFCAIAEAAARIAEARQRRDEDQLQRPSPQQSE